VASIEFDPIIWLRLHHNQGLTRRRIDDVVLGRSQRRLREDHAQKFREDFTAYNGRSDSGTLTVEGADCVMMPTGMCHRCSSSTAPACGAVSKEMDNTHAKRDRQRETNKQRQEAEI
jgi:hypothetical protein